MGLIDGLANGVSKAASGAADYYMKSIVAEEMSRIDQEKTLRLDEMKRSRDEADRVTRQSDYDSSLNETALSRLKGMYGKDGEGLSADDIADEEKNAVLTDKDRNEAAVRTGLISYKDRAALDNKDAVNETRMKVAEMQNALGIAKMDAQTQIAISKLEAAAAKAASSGATSAELTSFRGIVADLNKAREASGEKPLSPSEMMLLATGSKAVDTTKQKFDVDATGKRTLIEEEVNKKTLPGSNTQQQTGKRLVWGVDIGKK